MEVVAVLRSPVGRAWYLAVQACAVAGWWCWLTISPAVRSWFELDPASRRPLDAYLGADLVVLCAGSAAAAVAILRSPRWAGLWTGVTAGGALYATLQLLGWVLVGGDGAAGLAPMAVAAVGSGAVAAVTADQPAR